MSIVTSKVLLFSPYHYSRVLTLNVYYRISCVKYCTMHNCWFFYYYINCILIAFKYLIAFYMNIVLSYHCCTAVEHTLTVMCRSRHTAGLWLKSCTMLMAQTTTVTDRLQWNCVHVILAEVLTVWLLFSGIAIQTLPCVFVYTAGVFRYLKWQLFFYYTRTCSHLYLPNLLIYLTFSVKNIIWLKAIMGHILYCKAFQTL